jgi:O-antigen ligase
MKNDKTYSHIQYILLCIFAFWLPFSTPNFPHINFTPSLIALLLLIWLIQGNFKQKFNLLKINKLQFPFILCVGFYLLYLLGLSYSENFEFGLDDLLLKLPLLLFPFVIFTVSSDYWSKKHVLTILKCFVLGSLTTLIISVVHSWILFKENQWFDYFHYIYASWFHHPSYASMYYCFSFVIIIYLFLHHKLRLWEKISGGIAAILFLGEIVLLDSRAGILTLSSIVLIYILYIPFLKRKLLPYFFVGIIGMSGILLATYKLLPEDNNRIKQTIINVKEKRTSDNYTHKKEVRWLIWDASFKVAVAHLPFGVGTGDIIDELKKQYLKDEYLHPYEEEFNAHSQYLQVFATLGILGIIFLLTIVFAPLGVGYKTKNILFILFGVIIGINFIVESMLEKQAGIMFFSFFFVLLYFAPQPQPLKEKNE